MQTTRPNQVCKLLKSLYGLKQSSRQWFEKLSKLLIQCGFTKSLSDHSLFLKHTNTSTTVLLVYADDIVLAGDSLEEFSSIKHTLDTHFKIKYLGVLKYFLGLKVAHSSLDISICQHCYSLDLLKETGSLGCKPAVTLMDCSAMLT